MKQVIDQANKDAEKESLPCMRWSADILHLHGPDQAELLKDHVLEVNPDGLIQALRARLPGEAVEHDYRGMVIAPGFIDPHLHYPQLDVIGSAADGLLPWLEQHTFPAEKAFRDPAHAGLLAARFLDELINHGVTSASVYCTSHPNSVDAFMQACSDRNMAMMAGKVLQDRHSPEGLRDETEQSLRDSQTLIERWHGRSRLSYAITPRFAPTSSEAQLRGCAELAAAYPGVRIQSHVAENQAEIAWVRELFPRDRSYLAVYERLGLLQQHSIWAHCIHIDHEDRALLAARQAFAAVCPSSNLFLGSGLFDFKQAPFSWGLASDVGGGSSFSPFRTMLCAYEIARLQSHYLSPTKLWWQHSTGTAKGLGWKHCADGLRADTAADFIVINPRATALMQRRWEASESLDQQLFCLIVLGDDRHIKETVIMGRAAKRSATLQTTC
jgi:guanine deaminase